MAKRRGRLDPSEVKQAMRREEAPPETPFHSPFAALRGELEKLAPKRKAATVRVRQPVKPAEPSELARLRAAHKAEREALAEAVRPLRRRSAAPTGAKDE